MTVKMENDKIQHVRLIWRRLYMLTLTVTFATKYKHLRPAFQNVICITMIRIVVSIFTDTHRNDLSRYPKTFGGSVHLDLDKPRYRFPNVSHFLDQNREIETLQMLLQYLVHIISHRCSIRFMFRERKGELMASIYHPRNANSLWPNDARQWPAIGGK